MNKSIAIVLVLAAIAIAVASATVGVRGSYYSYPAYGAGYQYGPTYGYQPAGYRGYAYHASAGPVYQSYQPYYQPYYASSYYGPSYYPYPYAASKA